MVITEIVDGFVHNYSDKNLFLRQVETGRIYDGAYDIDARFTYEETDIPIPANEEE